MAAGKQEFDSAALLLKEVCYAAEHVNETERTIDWPRVKQAADRIAAAESEEFLVAAAASLWSGLPKPGSHFITALELLDGRLFDVFLKALRIRRGAPDPVEGVLEGHAYALFKKAELSRDVLDRAARDAAMEAWVAVTGMDFEAAWEQLTQRFIADREREQ